MIHIHTLGDWATYQQRLGGVGPDLKQSAAKSVYDLAVEVRQHLTYNILTGGFHVARLHPSTVRRKGHALPFLCTAGYVTHVQVLADPEGLRVGFPEGSRNSQGVLYSKVAEDLEFGNTRMRPRPHWRPTAQWVQKRVPGVGASILAGATRRV